MTILQGLLSIASGSLVGFTLGLVGGGGSILAVPLLVYVVGVPSPHVAIGTSAVAVAASAAANLAGHARAKTVKWPCAIVFALAGIAGAAGGAQLGKIGRRRTSARFIRRADGHCRSRDVTAAQVGRES